MEGLRISSGIGTFKNVLLLPIIAALLAAIGCASNDKKKDFATSGNAEADRRADSITEGKGSGKSQSNDRSTAKSNRDGDLKEENQSLYVRLGGEQGITAIVDDFIKRALEDPRVNWGRKGVTKGGLLRRDQAVEWQATPQNVQRLKLHFVQFISLAAGGPTEYGGKAVKPAHADMAISKSEFDAAIGDLKATLDKLNVANDAQKELLAIFESTRPQIVQEK